jgi:hypothetical protein
MEFGLEFVKSWMEIERGMHMQHMCMDRVELGQVEQSS